MGIPMSVSAMRLVGCVRHLVGMAKDTRTYAERRELALTDPQQRFAIGVAEGLSPTVAARVAGYSAPHVIASRLSRDPRVRELVRARRELELDKLSSVSLRALRELVGGYQTWEGKKIPISPAVRFQAVKLSLGLAGHVEKTEPKDTDNPLKSKDIQNMSVAELDAFLASEKAKRANDAKPIMDQVSCQEPANPLERHDKARHIVGRDVVVLDVVPEGEGEAAPIEGRAADIRPDIESE
jgi:hypothetical protein